MKKLLKICTAGIVLTLALSTTALAAQWRLGSKGWWYEYDDRTYPMQKWELINNNWYYFDSAGTMRTGWVKVADQWYYCETSGEMRTADLQTDVMLFKFNADGSCSNFYDNNIPSTQAGWATYNTGSIETLATAVLEGKVVHYNGQYWAKPDYVGLLKNEEVVYYNDIAPQETRDRYALSNMEIPPRETEPRDLDGIN